MYGYVFPNTHEILHSCSKREDAGEVLKQQKQSHNLSFQSESILWLKSDIYLEVFLLEMDTCVVLLANSNLKAMT